MVDVIGDVAAFAALKVQLRLNLQKSPDFIQIPGIEMGFDPVGPLTESLLHLWGEQFGVLDAEPGASRPAKGLCRGWL